MGGVILTGAEAVLESGIFTFITAPGRVIAAPGRAHAVNAYPSPPVTN